MQTYANLVDLEKCCQTHVFLQIFVLIQPRTSPPKIRTILQKMLILLTPPARERIRSSTQVMTYAERVAKREAEIEGLKEALEILSA